MIKKFVKKVLVTKLSNSKRFLNKVLSRTSLSSLDLSVSDESEEKMDELRISQDISALKDQVENLQAAVAALNNDTDKKDIALVNLIREKEKIALELVKQKRINANLVKQLEDERKFYYQEKEAYCQEMNEWKKVKKSLSRSTVSKSHKIQNDDKDLNETIQHYKKEIQRMKLTLNQTLEANYNLSVKFLRMKNTKTVLKTELKRTKFDHDRTVNDLKTKISNLSTQINDIVQDSLKTTITTSNKKYLQLVKHNSCLVYENLCLQLELDKMKLKFDNFKMKQTRSETNSRIKYIQRDEKNQTKRERIQADVPQKLEKEPQPSCSHQHKNHVKVTKIFEKTELPGVPKILFEKELDSRQFVKSVFSKSTKHASSVKSLTRSQSESNIQ